MISPFSRAAWRPPSRRTCGWLVALSLGALGGCLYGFSGGGFPPEIRTVAVLPFDNQTPDPTLSASVDSAAREALEGRLGLRPAGETQADAVVRGSITRYEPDVPVAYSGSPGARVDVTKRLVQITLSVEIVDQKKGKVLWQRTGLRVEGDYDPGDEAAGRRKALDRFVTNIVDGAQSQW